MISNCRAEVCWTVWYSQARGTWKKTSFLQSRWAGQFWTIHINITLQRCEHGSKFVFMLGKFPILLASDITSRGIHIPNAHYVVNYDFPGSLDQVSSCLEQQLYLLYSNLTNWCHTPHFTEVRSSLQACWQKSLANRNNNTISTNSLQLFHLQVCANGRLCNRVTTDMPCSRRS